MISTLRPDVFIIGAGPAGSIAGSVLARAGRRVLCFEGGTFPRFQIGESLLPRCNDLLEEAGLFDRVVKRNYQVKPAALFLRGDERERFCFADVFPGQRTQTYQVPRHDFDQTLAAGARAQGVDLRFNHRVDAVDFSGKRPKVVATDLESNTQITVEPQFVLDCSGYGRVLPKLLKLERQSEIVPRMALFTHVEGDLRPEGDAGGDIWVCCHPRGPWIWVIPFSDGRTSVGVVGDISVFDSVPGCDRDKLFALLREDPNTGKRLANAAPVLKTMKLQAWSAAVDKLHGPNWAVTGNAGEFLDPVFSSGVTLALESGSLAAKLAHRQLGGETIDWDKEYSAVVLKAVNNFKAFVRAWYEGELQEIFFANLRVSTVKTAITSILGGYVLDDQNPFVRDAEATIKSLVQRVRMAPKVSGSGR